MISIFESVPCFNVGEFLPWLSDHCPLFFTLEVQNCLKTPTSSEQTKTKAPKQYVWTERSKENYFAMIDSPEFKVKLDKSVEVDHSDPNLLINYISVVLVDAANKAKIKYRKCDSTNNPPWFDKSCQDLKENIKSLGSKIRKNCKDQSLKSELYAKKKELKKLIRTNKSKFKNDLMDQMKQSKNDSKRFWKLLDRMEKKADDTIFKKGISSHR